MNPVLAHMLQTGDASDDPVLAERGDGFSHLQPASVERLTAFLAEHKPEATLEVGMACGVSTLAICDALAALDGGRLERLHTAIDPHQASEYGDVGVTNLKRAGHEARVRLLRQRSDAALPQLIAQGHRVQFALVDGCHLFDVCLADLHLTDQLLDVGGVVAVDDLWMPSVRSAVSFFLRNRAYRLRWVAGPRLSTGARWRRLRRRAWQRPWLGQWKLKALPEQLVFLEKTGADFRLWDHHRSF